MSSVSAYGRRAGAFFATPLAAKVPEITFLFWVIKILTTAGGEATSDYLALGSKVTGGAIETGLLIIGLVWQFRTRRYTAAAYWFLAYAIATSAPVCPTPCTWSSASPTPVPRLLGVALAAHRLALHRSERTLSIHSITTRRRECFYWATVFATFALVPPSVT